MQSSGSELKIKKTDDTVDKFVDTKCIKTTPTVTVNKNSYTQALYNTQI